ncbi:MAG TPA: hypothetical protein VED85_02425, partial [Burkholderiaceae bacterium]|nr:hypothetical protein [Burkholderiaceae bacterium]
MIRAASRSAVSQLAWPLGIALLAVATYLPSLRASFQFDDWSVIVFDDRVGSLAAWAASMPGIRPLLKFSYAVNNELSRLPSGFRSVNIALHAINTLLVYILLHTLGTRQGRDASQVRRAALVATLLFALHPVQTEAVTYISGRSSSLSATFALGSLVVWTKAGDWPRPFTLVWVSAALFALALGAKETAIVLPLALLLWSAAARPDEDTAQSPQIALWPRAQLMRMVPHAALATLALLIAVSWPPYQRLLQASLQARDIGTNLLTQADAIFWLLGQLLCLSPINPDPALSVAS